MTVAAASINTTLSQWLRLLWDIAPPLRLNSDKPYIAGGAIHLPPRSFWQQHAAAAAHAASHFVYSPRVFEGDGLGAIARALMGLLEDARVEALAIRDLPGLARLWRPLHTATPALGCGFEALMERLARALIDPGYDDPDPWVRKGRMLFHHDVSGLQTPADVRRVATQLGHDIGQMRLQFNAKTYAPAPAYRDDHRWMWAADVLSTTPPPSSVTADSSGNDDPKSDLNESITRYPEWDRLIARLRPDWCSVIEQGMLHIAEQPAVMDEAVQQTAMRLRKPLRALVRVLARPKTSEEGEWFDLDALVGWHVARRLRHAPDACVYRGPERRSASAAAWLLVDHSASSAMRHGADGYDVLHTATASASASAAALQAIGVTCAVSAFSSEGRHAVRMVTVKSFNEPADNFTATRLQTLRPAGSTRLGAALRHVTSRLMEQRNGPRWVIVLSDGEAHDVDVHDPRYLIEDARHAVNTAARLGVRIVCLVLATDESAAQQIFGRAGVQTVHGLCDLPGAITRLIS
jgi:nitric oxide reductase NorD protein